MQVKLDRPQETYMWERFAEYIYGVQSGKKPETAWLEQSAMCNKLCIAVERSAQEDGKLIDVSNWF